MGSILVLRSVVGKTHVLRKGLVMDYTPSYFPLIVLGYPLDSRYYPMWAMSGSDLGQIYPNIWTTPLKKIEIKKIGVIPKEDIRDLFPWHLPYSKLGPGGISIVLSNNYIAL